VLGAGNPPQATVVSALAVIVGKAAGLTVIVLETEAKALPQESVAVHVSVTVPPHALGVAENVERFEVPLIKHPPDKSLEKEIVEGAGNPPQATVVSALAVIVGKAAGLTVIVLDTEAKALPQESVAVHVSVTVPPHALGVAENVEGFEVPLIKHPPIKPLENGIVVGAGNEPQATVVSAGAVIVGKAAGLIVIVLETEAKALPQESVAVHVSVTVPPQALGVAENVEGFEVPLIKHPPINPLENGIVLGAGKAPQATVVAAGAVIVGKAAGLIVITLETGANCLPQESVAVQVSVTVPPQALGVAEKVEGLEVPLTKHPPVKPLENGIVDGVGKAPQATVVVAGAVIVGKAAGLTVITLDTEAKFLPQESVAVQVSVTFPPQASGVAVKVDGLEVPLIKHPPLNPLENGIVLGTGNEPQATVVAADAVMVAMAAGLTVISLETGANCLPQESIAVQVSVTFPPQALGVAVKVDGLEVPLTKHPPVKPLENGIVDGAGKAPQATVVAAGAVIVGRVVGLIVITLETGANCLPQESVAVQVSVTVPPQASGVAVKVDGLEVPLTKQPPDNPLEKGIVEGAGKAPQATVVAAGAVIVGKAAGLTVIVLDTEAKALPQESVAVQVSVTFPPQALGVAEKVEGFEVPLIKHPPDKPLENGIVLGAGNPPQVTVVAAGAVIVGNTAGLTVIVLETGARGLPTESVAVQVSVIVPPQAPGAAENVEAFEVPLIKQAPLNPLVYVIVLGVGNEPQVAVVGAGAVIVGKVAGSTVIVLVCVMVRP
jgi:hypothetical protein